MKRIILHISERQYEWLEAEKAETGLNRAEIIRRAIGDYLRSCNKISKKTVVYENPDRCDKCFHWNGGRCMASGNDMAGDGLCDRFMKIGG